MLYYMALKHELYSK